jgi:hypothetical protein
MIRLIPAIIIMLYYWLFRIKFYGKLLIFSTVSSYLQTGPRPEGYPGVRHNALWHGINKLSITKRIHADLAVYMCCCIWLLLT